VKRDYRSWQSPALGQPMELLVDHLAAETAARVPEFVFD